MAELDAVERMCELFGAVLELDDVTPETDFFLAGGHSLSALSLAVAVEDAFGVRVGVRDVFDTATPELLAARLSGFAPPAVRSPGPDTARPPAAAPSAETPVAEATRWLWLERQRGGGDPRAYTVPCLLDGEGPVDVDRLAGALAAVTRRHPVLRTVFAEVRGEPRAVVTDEAPRLEVVDLRGDGPGQPGIEDLVEERLAVPFDTAAGPLTRTTLFLGPGVRWSLLLLADHLVCDGRSLEILATHLVSAYADPAAGGPQDGQPTHRPADPEAALAHWRRVLLPAGVPLPLPVRAARTRPVTTTAFAVRETGPDTLRGLTRLGGRHHAGPFAPLAAALARTLGGLTGRTDICLGTAVDLRARLGAGDAVGFHVATVPLRLEVGERMPGDDLVRQVARRTLDAVDHSQIAFDQLVAELDPPRSPGRMPFFDVWVALYPRIDTGEPEPGGIALSGGPVPVPTGMFELSFQFVEHANGMRLLLQYDDHRYAADTAERMVQRLADELAHLLRDPAAPGAGAAPAERSFGGYHFDA